MSTSTSLPLLIAGPIVRRLSADKFSLWFVTTKSCQFHIAIDNQTLNQQEQHDIEASVDNTVQVGEQAFISLIDINLDHHLRNGDQFTYQLGLKVEGEERVFAEQLLPNLLYDGESKPTVVFKSKLDSLLHGSCRKPHYDSGDALVTADEKISDMPIKDRPALLMMSGDQIYADDVAGPLLSAIHQVMNQLGLWTEQLSGASVNDTQQLLNSPNCYYAREQLLPDDEQGDAVEKRLFNMVRKPIFTSDAAHNHLITLSEVVAMYLLVWSPVLWRNLNLEVKQVSDKHFDRYQNEQRVIRQFADNLPKVQRLMAHIPSYMMFDDHDVTDDWNLTRAWEETAYGHSFSKRILGNALVGYWLCQGWGNEPERFDKAFKSIVQQYFNDPQDNHHNHLINHLLDYSNWHYCLPTSPKLVVLDTRTHRWRSENSPTKPSGLMDWEALSELQNELIGEKSVLLISPAPIFGVKLIEAVQRIFTLCGRALTVDAENWMAHPGSANVILNIFQHPKTPQNFIILSGDVHYSFTYDVSLRMRKRSPDIWQITCSGMKNEFPGKLLAVLDRINTALFGSKSPLNVFTKRRRMRIKARKPSTQPLRRLLMGSGIGYLKLTDDGRPQNVVVWLADGEDVSFDH